MATTDRLLTTAEVASLCGVREQTVIAWRTRETPDRPQPVKLGSRSVRYHEADVLRWRDRETKVRSWSGDRKKSTTRRSGK
jgi:predicted DNA-binding transcriptional regulator AlpA